MQERRGHMRDKVLLGAVAEIREIGSTVDCVVRNLSDNGACVEFKTSVNLPDQMKLMIKRRALLSRQDGLAAGQQGRPRLPHHGDGPAGG
jgi:PilZ domain